MENQIPELADLRGRETKKKMKDPVVCAHAERLQGAYSLCADISMKQILETVFADVQIQQEFRGAHIRYTTMCISVAKELLEMLGNREQITMMAVGDVQLPTWARGAVIELFQESHRRHIDHVYAYGTGYDLTSKGALSARQLFFDYISEYYGFAEYPEVKEQFVTHSTICAGGMRALDDISTALVRETLERDERSIHRFISPDNSFGTWHAIANLRSNNERTEVHVVETQQEEQLQPSARMVRAWYEDTSTEGFQDSWYITPVGNPSGTAMGADALYETCQEIVRYQPNATIILDNTYVRMLPKEQAKKLLMPILAEPLLRDRIILVESFSKTHGFCGERIGVYFSTNPALYGSVQTVNMTLSAGNGRYRDALVEAITTASSEVEATIGELHQFWMRERKGLYRFLTQEQFVHLFATEQRHVESLFAEEEPLGMYLFLKLADGVTARDVLIATGCGGVETSMGSGTYVRFAVGTLQEPIFSAFA